LNSVLGESFVARNVWSELGSIFRALLLPSTRGDARWSKQCGEGFDVGPAWRSIALFFSKSWQIFFVDEGDEGLTLL
jgi:hypothetical protein